MGEADASFLDCVVPAHTDAELKTVRSHKSTKSIFVPVDPHSEHPYNTQTNAVELIPQEALYVLEQYGHVNKKKRGRKVNHRGWEAEYGASERNQISE